MNAICIKEKKKKKGGREKNIYEKRGAGGVKDKKKRRQHTMVFNAGFRFANIFRNRNVEPGPCGSFDFALDDVVCRDINKSVLLVCLDTI